MLPEGMQTCEEAERESSAVMSIPSSFFRYVAGRYHGRLAAARHTSMTAFVLMATTGKEPTRISFWFGAAIGVLLYPIRIVKAVFDSTFEAIGFLLGRLILFQPLLIRILAGLATLILVCLSVYSESNWLIASFVTLFALDMIPTLGKGGQDEPRLLTASVKSYSVAAVTFWAWQFNWLAAPLGFCLTRRAFQFLYEGMTICAAQRAQLRRDRKTEALFRSITMQRSKSELRERMILYLRPFAITGRIKTDDGEFLEAADNAAIVKEHDGITKEWRRTIIPIVNLNVGVSETASLFEQGNELESIIEQAMNGAGHFIALGSPGEALGAGRLPSSESEWQETIRLMIEAATICIAIPSANSGTRWELEYLIDNGLLGKCCVLMPPVIGKFSYETEWLAAREALAEKIPLPDYDPRGGLFRFDGQTSATPPTIDAIPQGKVEMFALCIQLLFPELPKWKVDSGSNWVRAGFGLKTATYFGRSEKP
ncbi:hypothetical protein [Lysobacter sp. 22409]|uniref:hypothetical protein n=1 Tax=Lysobacter sp. 22409 TaxID=3453917 RepID=UPI003F874CE7